MGDKTDNKAFMGLKSKTWAIIILSVLGALLLIFVVIPFVIATFIPPIDGVKLVNHLDGLALAVGILGTFASVLSIIMTFMDRDRFNKEQEKANNMMMSIDGLHKDLDKVTAYVKDTFVENHWLADTIRSSKIIKTKGLSNVSATLNPKANKGDWASKDDAKEVEN